MSDQDKDNKKTSNEPDRPLDIEIVSLQDAEQEASVARAEVTPKHALVQQELIEQMSEVIDKVDTGVDEDQIAKDQTVKDQVVKDQAVKDQTAMDEEGKHQTQRMRQLTGQSWRLPI